MQNSKYLKKTPPLSEEDMPLERQSQISSILRILRDSLAKLRLSLILPKLFENIHCTLQHLSEFKYEGDCVKLIQQCVKEQDMDATNQSPRLSCSSIKLIDFFYENVQLLDYFNDWLDDISPVDKSLLDSFQFLLVMTEQRLKKSAISELNKEKKIHEVYQENQKLNLNIKAMQTIVRSRHINTKWKTAAEEILIKKYENDIAINKYESNIKIKQEIVRSSRNIRQIHLSSEVKQKELEAELVKVRTRYECLLSENIKQERSARDEKNKLLLQLEALIKKHDQIMGEKSKENMYLREEFKQQSEQFKIFLVEYNREEIEYDRIVRLKKEEEKHQQEQKILFFMMNRSARVIQKHWRRFRRAQKKAAKRSKGRGKSKKK